MNKTERDVRDSSGLSRRTVVRGAAWSVPVVSMAATAPAFAASNILCPTLPGETGWTTTTSGTLGAATSGGYAWENGSWIVYRDNGSTSAPLVFTSTSPSMTVTPGATYAGDFSFWWGYGNGRSDQSTQGTFELLIGGTVVKTLTTRTAAVDGGASTGIQTGTTTQTFSYKVPAGTRSVAVAYRYTLTARTSSACDDIIVSRLNFTTCTVN